MTYVRIMEELLGKTLTSVEQHSNDEIVFTVNDDEQYRMYHQQDCCECVLIEDVVGDLQDLVGAELVEAEEVSTREPWHTLPEEEAIWKRLQNYKFEQYDESNTWTFYKFRTAKGCVTIRWLGSSNGYYSESVDFVRINRRH